MYSFRRINLVVLTFGLIFGLNISNAEEVLDQEFDATNGGASVAVAYPFGFAQTFTTGREGILSRVALMLGRQEAATGDFTLMILPTTSEGFPDGSGALLFSKSYPVTAVSTIGPFQYTYTTFDISEAGISVVPGDQLAIAITRQSIGAEEWLQWDVNVVGGYAGGASFQDRTGGIDDWEFYGFPGPGAFGFQTFVSSEPPKGKPQQVGPAFTDRGFQCDGLIVIGHPGEYEPTFENGNGLILGSLGDGSKLTISNDRNGNINFSCRGKLAFGTDIAGVQPALGQEAFGRIVSFEEMCDTWNIVAPGACKNGGAIKIGYKNLGVGCSGFGTSTQHWQQVISPNGNTMLMCSFK